MDRSEGAGRLLEQMMSLAKAAIARVRLYLCAVPTRRFRPIPSVRAST